MIAPPRRRTPVDADHPTPPHPTMIHPMPAASPEAVADRHRRRMLDALVRQAAALAAGQVDLAAAFRDRARMHRAELRAATGMRKPA